VENQPEQSTRAEAGSGWDLGRIWGAEGENGRDGTFAFEAEKGCLFLHVFCYYSRLGRDPSSLSLSFSVKQYHSAPAPAPALALCSHASQQLGCFLHSFVDFSRQFSTFLTSSLCISLACVTCNPARFHFRPLHQRLTFC
jgi:hypothetical protein